MTTRKSPIANCQLQIANCRLVAPIENRKSKIKNRLPRPAFTLPELLITIAIISLLAGLGLTALGGATELAREQRTQSMIDKIDQFIRERYEDYRTRAMPIKMPTVPAQYPPFYQMYANGGQLSRANAMLRLQALHAMMRMELPDRRTDIINFTTSPYSPELPSALAAVPLANPAAPYYMPSAALQKTYFRMAVKQLLAAQGRTDDPRNPGTWVILDAWTPENEGAECLYLIIASMRDGDKHALDYFGPDEIGDTDADGMKEILDGWGTPITFLRWAPGYCEQPGSDNLPGKANIDDDNNGTVDDITEFGWPDSDDSLYLVKTFQTRNAGKAPNPFDPARVDPRWLGSPIGQPYALHPLILSAGPDRQYEIKLGFITPPTPFRYAAPPSPSFPNDPYFNSLAAYSEPQLGTPFDEDGDGVFGFLDNLSNHAQQAP